MTDKPLRFFCRIGRWLMIDAILLVAICAVAAAPAAGERTERIERLKDRDRLNKEANKLIREANFADAAKTVEQVLAIERDVLGDDDSAVLYTLDWLSELKAFAGDFAGARKLGQLSLSIQQKGRPESHWRIGHARRAMAFVELLAALGVEKRERLRQARIMFMQAREFREQRKFAEAVSLLQKVLEIRKNILGEESVGYINALDFLSVVYRNNDDYHRAIEALSRVIALRQKVIGEEHPSYANALSGLAWNHFYLKEYDAAEKLFREASEVVRKSEGELSLNYAIGLQNLGEFYSKRKNFERAVAVSRQGADIYRKVKGEHHPDYAYALDRLAVIYDGYRAFDQAEPLLQQALAIYRQAPKDNRHRYIECLKELVFNYGETGNRAKAVEMQLQVIDLQKEMWGAEHADIAESLHFLRYLYVEMNEFGKGLQAERQAAAILKKALGEKHTRYIDCLHGTAWLLHRHAVHCQEQDDLPSARKALEEFLALRIQLFGEDRWQTADARRFLAHQSLLESMSTEQRRGLREADKLWQQGWAFDKQGKYREAFPVAEKALALRRQLLGNEHWLTGDAIFLVAWLHAEMRDILRAESLYLESLEIVRKTRGTAHPDYPTDLHNLATLYYRMGDFSRAETMMLEALEITKKLSGGKDNDYALVVTTLALVYEGMGNYVRSEQYHRQALAIRLDLFGANHKEYAHSLLNLGGLYVNMGDYARAEPMVLQATEIRKRAFGEKHPAYATCLNALGELYRRKREYAKAEPYLQEAMRIRKETLGEKHPEYAMSLNNLGLLYSKMGDFARATPLYEQAVEISKATVGEHHLNYSLAIHNLAWLYIDTGQYAKAEPLLRQSIEIRKEVLGENDLNDHASSLDSLAHLYGLMGQPDKGVPLSLKAIQIGRAYSDKVALVQSERQQMSVRVQVWHYLDTYLALADAAGVPAEEVYGQVLAWKGFVTARQQRIRELRAIQASSQPETARLFTQLEEATRQLAVLSRARSGSESTDRRFELRDLGERIEHLQTELAKLNSDVRKEIEQRRRTPDDIRKALPAGVVLIDLLTYEPLPRTPENAKKVGNVSHLVAFIVCASQPVRRVELGPAEPITHAIESWRRDFGAPRAGKEASGDALRRLVWMPLESHIGDARVLLVSPNSTMASFPWAALPGTKPGSYLIEERAVALVPIPLFIPELLSNANARPNEMSLLMVGDVDFDAAPGLADKDRLALAPPSPSRSGSGPIWGRLPGTRAEVDAIKAAFPRQRSESNVRELRGSEPTGSAIRKQVSQHQYLHFATHGFFAPPGVRSVNESGSDPASDIVGFHPGLLSGIVLAGANQSTGANQDNGILTALEVGELDLRLVELATLSACETGLGQSAGGEGVLGLQRAFQTAGARTVVASLWRVDDAATQQLMVRFYENLWQKKLPKLEALRQAQLSMIRQDAMTAGDRGMKPSEDPAMPAMPAHRNPRLWAAWVLSGDPGDLSDVQALLAPSSPPPAAIAPIALSSDRKIMVVTVIFLAVLIALLAWLSQRSRRET